MAASITIYVTEQGAEVHYETDNGRCTLRKRKFASPEEAVDCLARLKNAKLSYYKIGVTEDNKYFIEVRDPDDNLIWTSNTFGKLQAVQEGRNTLFKIVKTIPCWEVSRRRIHL